MLLAVLLKVRPPLPTLPQYQVTNSSSQNVAAAKRLDSETRSIYVQNGLIQIYELKCYGLHKLTLGHYYCSFFIYFIYNDNYDTHTTVQPLVKEVLRSPA